MSSVVLRSRKKVPWLVGDVDARVITLSTCYIPPEPTRVSCLNQPKALVDDECYQYQHVCAQNGWKIGKNIEKYIGGVRNLTGGGRCGCGQCL
jgi:hypothetical protein